MRDTTGTDPEVTVVICTHNRQTWLERCIESVLRQKGVSWEMVIVDDASTDGTREWLQARKELRARIVHLPVSSERSTGRNRGLAEAYGGYVMFLDDDDWLWPGALRVLKAALDSHPGAVAAVGARWVWFMEEDYRRRDAHPRSPRICDIFDELLFGWSAVSGQNLYRTELVRKVGGYDTSMVCCEDRDLWFRLAVLGNVVLRPEIVMTYRVHPHQRRPSNIRQIRERVAQRAIRALPAGKRQHALLLRRSTWFLDRAEDELSAGRFSSGLLYSLRAVANTPAIFSSPLIGEWVFRRLAGRVARRFFRPKAVSVDSISRSR